MRSCAKYTEVKISQEIFFSGMFPRIFEISPTSLHLCKIITQANYSLDLIMFITTPATSPSPLSFASFHLLLASKGWSGVWRGATRFQLA